jgi:hypothetical protein
MDTGGANMARKLSRIAPIQGICLVYYVLMQLFLLIGRLKSFIYVWFEFCCNMLVDFETIVSLNPYIFAPL